MLTIPGASKPQISSYQGDPLPTVAHETSHDDPKVPTPAERGSPRRTSAFAGLSWASRSPVRSPFVPRTVLVEAEK